MMKKGLIFCCCFFLSALRGQAQEAKFYISPSILPYTTTDMQTAGFWISRHPSPDEIILSSESIQQFNQTLITDLKLNRNLFDKKIELVDKKFQQSLMKSFDEWFAKKYLNSKGQRETQDYFNAFKKNVVVYADKAQWGLIVHYTDQRFLPTHEGLFATAGDVDFDELQNSALDVGSPVAIVASYNKGQWLYAIGTSSEGWVRSADVAIGLRDQIEKFVTESNFIVTINSKNTIFSDPTLRQYHTFVQMGTRLPIKDLKNPDSVEVSIPMRNEDGTLVFASGYLAHDDVHVGFLSYTARTIYNQAFKMLNAPYGWGGARGEQDCSRFLQMVFASVGINLPRDSKNQRQVGLKIAEYSDISSPQQKLIEFAKVLPGVSFLCMKGHIMLYLGLVDRQPYAIHAVWAYREHVGDQDVPRVLNRVVVSDLSLGEGSTKGSLLKRLAEIRTIQ